MSTTKPRTNRTFAGAARIDHPVIGALIKAIQQSIYPQLLQVRFRKGNAGNPLFGHCYHSAEALYHLIREAQLPEEWLAYRPCRGVDQNNIPHWWLQDERGNILDPTAGQYTSLGIDPPYESGRFRSFLTQHPSRKAQKLIEIIHTRTI